MHCSFTSNASPPINVDYLILSFNSFVKIKDQKQNLCPKKPPCWLVGTRQTAGAMRRSRSFLLPVYPLDLAILSSLLDHQTGPTTPKQRCSECQVLSPLWVPSPFPCNREVLLFYLSKSYSHYATCSWSPLSFNRTFYFYILLLLYQLILIDRMVYKYHELDF